MQKLIFTHLLLLSCAAAFGGLTFTSHAQNSGSFLLIRTYGKNSGSQILESRVYEKYRSQIKVDSSKIVEYGPYEVLFIDKGNKSIREFKFKDSTGLNLGRLRDSLKTVEPRYGMGAAISFARQMADSLVKSGVYFYTVPQLAAKETYELSFTAFFGSNDPENNPAYWDFRQTFTKEFESGKGKKNVHMYMSREGELGVLLYLENKDFDLKRLDKYTLNFSKKPIIRPRLYELVLFEQ
ncbi:MAG: hypothetical protein K0R65_2015 [Crocinitomicaceae bacterium]|jgi:hypothetical protein|nr:hypothetical protein [Crocinitomicaceae bacterium]